MFEADSVLWLGGGLLALLLAWGLRTIERTPVPFPALVVAAGAAYFAVPASPSVPLDAELVLRLAEASVIVSLFGVGLKIDRLPRWSTWSVPTRLLVVCMPLSIAAVALLGHHGLGLPVATAVLLGAVLAPTDPVLASDVQVGEPLEAMEHPPDEEPEDEIRFGLTAEAGLNDALAFPFTYLAIRMAEDGTDPGAWLGEWLLVDIVRRFGVGIVVGIVVGRLLAAVLLRLPTGTARDRTLTGVGALAATFLLYGTSEVLGGYGFLSVFIGAVAFRLWEWEHETHVALHVVAEQTEQLMLVVILFGLGGALVSGALEPLGLDGALLVLAVVFVIRPAFGMVSLLGSPRVEGRRRFVVAAFGVRGVGSIFYLAYAVAEATFEGADELTAIVAAIIAVSIVVHGVAAPLVVAPPDEATGDPRQDVQD